MNEALNYHDEMEEWNRMLVLEQGGSSEIIKEPKEESVNDMIHMQAERVALIIEQK